ncbi:MAG: periplasmic heavy metal sensor [Candidatus Margulisbacteria bacterium]|jgi:Spy/CpxP family protein refolding chaperone|nr:periplasmic heavy metal sensor [Candidatus Margulisiibacteriota bacterium]
MNIKKIGMVILILTMVALAGPEGKPDKPDQAERGRQPFKELNLTAEQTQQLESNRKAVDKTMRDNRTKLAQEHKKLREELFKAAPSEAEIALSRKNILELEGLQLDNMIANARELRKVLTEEQLVKLKEWQEKNFREPDRQKPQKEKAELKKK